MKQSKKHSLSLGTLQLEMIGNRPQDCLANSDGELDTPFLAEVLHSIEESKKDFQSLMERTEGEDALTELLEVFQNLEASTESYDEMKSASTAARAAAPEVGERGQSGIGDGGGKGEGEGQDGAAQGEGSGGGWSAEARAEFNLKVKEAIQAGSSQPRVKVNALTQPFLDFFLPHSPSCTHSRHSPHSSPTSNQFLPLSAMLPPPHPSMVVSPPAPSLPISTFRASYLPPDFQSLGGLESPPEKKSQS